MQLTSVIISYSPKLTNHCSLSLFQHQQVQCHSVRCYKIKLTGDVLHVAVS